MFFFVVVCQLWNIPTAKASSAKCSPWVAMETSGGHDTDEDQYRNRVQHRNSTVSRRKSFHRNCHENNCEEKISGGGALDTRPRPHPHPHPHPLCIYSIYCIKSLTVQPTLLFSNFTTKVDDSGVFSRHKPGRQLTGFWKGRGVDWKGTGLYSVVKLLKQRAGRNCCSSICAACVYERGLFFFYFYLFIFAFFVFYFLFLWFFVVLFFSTRMHKNHV